MKRLLTLVSAPTIEAVQFGKEFGPWHAVLNGEDSTLCGKNAIKAHQMYRSWDADTHAGDRCKTCVLVLAIEGIRIDDPEWVHLSWPTIEDYIQNVTGGDRGWSCNTCWKTFDAASLDGYEAASKADKRWFHERNYRLARLHMMTHRESP